jgi:hypothetical protein
LRRNTEIHAGFKYKSLLDNSTQSLTDVQRNEIAKILELEFPEIMRLLELPIAVIWG